MKNPDEKVNIEAFRDAKKLHLAGGGGMWVCYSPIYITYIYHGVPYVASVSVQFWKKERETRLKECDYAYP